jgi:hypothetical protein
MFTLLCAAGCGWIVGVGDDPVVVDTEPPDGEAGMEGAIPVDSAPNPPHDAPGDDVEAAAD